MKSASLKASTTLALLGVSALSSCDSLDKSYNVYSDQVAPIRDDSVAVESGAGLEPTPVPELVISTALSELTAPPAPTAAPAVNAQQNAPELPKPTVEEKPEPKNTGARQNAPELPKPAAAAPAASMRQNAPELPRPEPKNTGARQNAPAMPAKPVVKPAPKPEPKNTGARQNAPAMPAKPVVKPAPKPEPKNTGARQNAPAVPAKPVVKPAPKPEPKNTGARQNAPATPAKPAAKPAPKPEPKVKGARQNAPAAKPVAKPVVKPAPKPEPAAKGARQNAPAAKPVAKPVAKPAPKPTPKAQPAPKARTPLVVTLKKDETLVTLARRHGVSLSALYKANGITAKTTLRPGSKVTIPKRSFFRRILRLPWVGTRSAATPATTTKSSTSASRKTSAPAAKPAPAAKATSYTVQRGDTLSGIAAKFRVSTAALTKANNITPNQARLLREGRVLRIPN